MPPDNPVKILFVGDMHLGRRASRIPGRAKDLGGFDDQDLSPVGAWRRVVQVALDQQVQAVALAGDLVHQDDDLFEARAHLERGIRQLDQAGITVVAVAGNHDTRVLPALADEIEGLHLLGPGGTWSTCTVAAGVRIAGWSFPARHHPTSPLQDAPPAPSADMITLGLLHADLGATRSNYAPVTTAELDLAGYQGWALGHIHAPDPVPGPDAPRRPFYLGSITGAIPTETGAHGPVLATVSATGEISWERLVLAPLRWEHRTVSVDNLVLSDEARELATELRTHLLAQAGQIDLGPEWPHHPALALGLRLTLAGTHARADDLQRAAAGFEREDLATLVGDRTIFIEKISSTVTVPMDMEQLATRNDPPGLLAREILALRKNAPTAAPLLAQARQAIAGVTSPLDPDQSPWSDDVLRRHLIEAGHRALNALLSQTGGRTS